MNKTKGIMLLALFLLSIVSVVAELEIVPELPEDLSNKYFCDDVEFVDYAKDKEVKPLCKEKPSAHRKGGRGGFYIAKGKTLFGMTSEYDGRAVAGLIVGKITPYRPSREMNFVPVKVKLLGKTRPEQKINAFQIKSIPDKTSLAKYEILNNMGEGVVMVTTWRVTAKEKVKFLLNGKEITARKQPSKSKVVTEYQTVFNGGGILEIVKAQ